MSTPKINQTGRPLGAVGTVSAIKIAQIARWRMAGVSLIRCGELLGMSAQGIKAITETLDYIEYEEALLNNHLSAMDEALAGKVSVIHQQFRAAVPAAMRALVESVTQRRDLKTALAAAKEILDRDPDRTLPTHSAKQAEDEAAHPRLPDEVLTQAVTESNEIAKALNQNDKKGVN